MSDDDYKKLWAGVVNQMNVTRNLKYFSNKTADWEIEKDKDAIALQKEQFKAYRQEIINIYVTRLNARSTRLSPEEIDNILALPHKYWNDIAKMGIDPHAVFDESLDKSNFEVDYERWKKGTKYELKTTNSGWKQVFDIASHFQQTAEKVQNPQNGTWQDQMVPKPNIPRQSESPKTHHIPKDDGDEELVYET